MGFDEFKEGKGFVGFGKVAEGVDDRWIGGSEEAVEVCVGGGPVIGDLA